MRVILITGSALKLLTIQSYEHTAVSASCECNSYEYEIHKHAGIYL